MRISLMMVLLTVSCAPLADGPEARGEICREAFRDYDRQVRLSGADRPRMGVLPLPPRQDGPGFGAESKLLQFDCLLRPEEMPDLEAIDRTGLAKPAPLTPAPRQYVHLALVTGNADEGRLRDFAEGLGYNAGGKGVPFLGRRVFLGPFSSVEEQQAALRLAGSLGIRSAYLLTRIP